jgi:hypothetical protein
MLSPAEDASNPAGLGRATIKSSLSPQDEYYRYKLMEAKLGKDSAILKARSEQDDVEIIILNKLLGVRESTAEWNQVVDLTGSQNRFEQARILAEISYEKQKAEKVLAFYVPTPDQLKGIFDETNRRGLAVRSGGGAIGGVAQQSSASALASAVGVGGGGGGGGGAE